MVDADESTKEKLLRATEGLYAERGYAQSSLREVTDRAGVNLAAVSYHFGSKEGLFEEMLRRRIEPVNRRRYEMLANARREAGTGPIGVERILRVLVEPLVDALEDGSGRVDRQFLGVIARSMSEEADFVEWMHRRFFDTLKWELMEEMRRALPGYSQEELGARFYLAASTLFGCVVLYPRLGAMVAGPGVGEMSFRSLMERMVELVSIGIVGKSLEGGGGVGPEREGAG